MEQPSSRRVRPLVEEVAEFVVWWATQVECASAAARLRREGLITPGQEARALDLLAQLWESVVEVQPSSAVRTLAGRLLRTHPLRAADALQLAAALVWAGTPAGDVVVTLDQRLAEAAALEGFRVVPSR